MELSQTSLAMLLLGGLPIGVVLNLAYVLTDIGALPNGFAKTLLGNVKDFVFAVAAGLAVIVAVYFVNQGEFRYMVVVGLVGGFAAAHLMLRTPILRARNAVVRTLTVPIVWVWQKTLGKLLAVARSNVQEKQTQIRIEQVMQLASNGFEN